MRKLDRIDEAQKCFEKVIELNSGFIASYRGLVDCAMTSQDFDTALNFCEAALQIAEDDVSLLTDKANVLLKLGRAEDAIPAYERVVKHESASPQVQQLYAIALSQVAVAADKAGDLSRAEELYSKAIAIDATSTRLFNRAFLFMRTERVDEAIDGFAAVLSADSTNIKARAALGTLLLQQQRFEEAVQHLRLASKGSKGEEFADVTYNLGFALLKLSRYQAAVQAFQSVLEADPENENAKNGLKAAQAQIAKPSSSQPSPAVSQAVQPEGPAVPQSAPVEANSAESDIQSTPAAVAAASATSESIHSLAHAASAVPEQEPSRVAKAPALITAAGDRPIFALADLQQKPFPEGVDASQREIYLSRDEFMSAFEMDIESFNKLPKWKRVTLKKKVGLF